VYIAGAYSQQETPTNCDLLAPTASSHRNLPTSPNSLTHRASHSSCCVHSNIAIHRPTIGEKRCGTVNRHATHAWSRSAKSLCSDLKQKAETIQSHFATDIPKQGRYASLSSTTVDVYHIWGVRSILSRPHRTVNPASRCKVCTRAFRVFSVSAKSRHSCWCQTPLDAKPNISYGPPLVCP
jgi:hypothetical protein